EPVLSLYLVAEFTIFLVCVFGQPATPFVFLARRRFPARRKGQLAFRSCCGRQQERVACLGSRDTSAQWFANRLESVCGLCLDTFRDNRPANRSARRLRLARANRLVWLGPWRIRRSDNFARPGVPVPAQAGSAVCRFRRRFPKAMQRQLRCARQLKRKNSRTAAAESRRCGGCMYNPSLRGYSSRAAN